MPAVDVYYKPGFMEVSVAAAIKTVVKGFGHVMFSTRELRLSPGDFSFKFHEPTKFDDLTNEIIVRIRLHEFPERVHQVNDGMCDELAADLLTMLGEDFSPDRVLSVGVELFLGNISWGSARSPRRE